MGVTFKLKMPGLSVCTCLLVGVILKVDIFSRCYLVVAVSCADLCKQRGFAGSCGNLQSDYVEGTH